MALGPEVWCPLPRMLPSFEYPGLLRQRTAQSQQADDGCCTLDFYGDPPDEWSAKLLSQMCTLWKTELAPIGHEPSREILSVHNERNRTIIAGLL